MITNAIGPPPSPCQACGACCETDASWPRFTLESDQALARIPGKFIATNLSGMACVNDRCSALVGNVGAGTACAIYAIRPDVCRACEPGDDACAIARSKWGMAPL
jgi:uncharacterized protein